MNKKIMLAAPIFLLFLSVTIATATAQESRICVTHLYGREEVPPVETQAQGQAIFMLSKDGQTLYYKLIAANINNILQAHIHLAAEGVNGPVVAWLYPSQPPAVPIPGRFSGVLAEGEINAGDLV